MHQRFPEVLEDAVLNRLTLKGERFTPKDSKWKSLAEISEVKQWGAIITNAFLMRRARR